MPCMRICCVLKHTCNSVRHTFMHACVLLSVSVCMQVVDMPLLFETGAHKLIRPNVLVSCSPEVQVG